MPDISIQFHALPGELLPLIHTAIAEMGLHILGITFQPFMVRELTSEEIDQAVLSGPYRRFMFAEEAPRSLIQSAADLAEQFPGALYLEVGRESINEGLSESWLAARTGTLPMNAKWKAIASRLRAMTRAGAVAVSLTTGATSSLKNHRFSAGAKELCDRGVQIRPAAGKSVLKLGKTD